MGHLIAKAKGLPGKGHLTIQSSTEYRLDVVPTSKLPVFTEIIQGLIIGNHD